MNNLLETIGLNAGYGPLQIIFDVNLTVPDNKITIVIGANGTGKSTILKAIMGEATVLSGTIKFEGDDITPMESYKRTRRGIGYMPQVDNIFNDLKVRENLRMASYTIDESRIQDNLEKCLQLFPKLKELMDRSGSNLSGGEKHMLAASMVLMREPKIFILDEPTSGLMPKLVTDFLMKLKDINEELGLPILMVEQRAREALKIGDKAYLVRDGRLKFEGSAEELLNYPKLTEMYFGLV